MKGKIVKDKDVATGECGFVEVGSKTYLLFNECEVIFFDSKGDFDETLFDKEAENPSFGLMALKEKLYINIDNVDLVGKHEDTVYLVLSNGKMIVSENGKLEKVLREFGFDFPSN